MHSYGPHTYPHQWPHSMLVTSTPYKGDTCLHTMLVLWRPQHKAGGITVVDMLSQLQGWSPAAQDCTGQPHNKLYKTLYVHSCTP